MKYLVEPNSIGLNANLSCTCDHGSTYTPCVGHAPICSPVCSIVCPSLCGARCSGNCGGRCYRSVPYNELEEK